MARADEGWFDKALTSLVGHALDVSDARRMARIEDGELLDDHGLPLGTIPAAFVDHREESRLVYPHSRQVFRRVQRGAGSTLARVISFDAPPHASLDAGYVAHATGSAVLDWYQAELEARGWQGRPRRPLRDMSDLGQVFHRARESFSVEIPPAPRAQRHIEHAGLGWPLTAEETYFTVQYIITVEPPTDRLASR